MAMFLISDAIIDSFKNESSFELHGRQPNTQVNELIAPNFLIIDSQQLIYKTKE